MRAPYYLLARALVHKDALDEAFTDYMKAHPNLLGPITLGGTGSGAHMTSGSFVTFVQSLDGFDPTPEGLKCWAIRDFGLFLDGEGRQDDAIAAFRKAIRDQPDWPPIHIELAAFLENKDLLDEAVVERRKLIELQPDEPERHNDLGKVFLRLWRLDEALAEYRKAIELDPKDGIAHTHLVAILREEGKNAGRRRNQEVRRTPAGRRAGPRGLLPRFV